MRRNPMVPAGPQAVFQALEEVGADVAEVRLESESKAEALAELDQIAQKVL